jgi:hypothetical protein
MNLQFEKIIPPRDYFVNLMSPSKKRYIYELTVGIISLEGAVLDFHYVI